MGSTFNEIVALAKKNFKETHIFKPPASRKESKESFIICKFLRQVKTMLVYKNFYDK